jgi:hypothetical protein
MILEFAEKFNNSLNVKFFNETFDTLFDNYTFKFKPSVLDRIKSGDMIPV